MKTTSCRRVSLLTYFSDNYKGSCNNCDICLDKDFKVINATKEAKTALTAVYEVDQRYNVHYLVELLTGVTSPHIQRNGHLELTSFGYGKDSPLAFWYRLFRQLISSGHLRTIMDGTSEVKLTNKAIDVIEGRQEVFIRKDFSQAKSTQGATSAKTRKRLARRKSPKKTVNTAKKTYLPSDGSDRTLFENLKKFRSQLAKKKRTKAFKIFPDKTLMELASNRPQNLEELEGIYGVSLRNLKV